MGTPRAPQAQRGAAMAHAPGSAHHSEAQAKPNRRLGEWFSFHGGVSRTSRPQAQEEGGINQCLRDVRKLSSPEAAHGQQREAGPAGLPRRKPSDRPTQGSASDPPA